jgi:hypothetical protein
VTKLTPVMELLACVFRGVKLMGSMQCSEEKFHEYSFLSLKLMTAFLIYDRNFFPSALMKTVIIMFEN